MSQELALTISNQPFKCGTCNVVVKELETFHMHLLSHVEGCGYFYDFATRTAHIKLMSVSIGCETDTNDADIPTWTVRDSIESSNFTYNTESNWDQTESVTLDQLQHACIDNIIVDYPRPMNINIAEEVSTSKLDVAIDSFPNETGAVAIKQEIIETDVFDCANANSGLVFNENQFMYNEVKEEPNIDVNLTQNPKSGRCRTMSTRSSTVPEEKTAKDCARSMRMKLPVKQKVKLTLPKKPIRKLNSEGVEDSSMAPDKDKIKSKFTRNKERNDNEQTDKQQDRKKQKLNEQKKVFVRCKPGEKALTFYECRLCPVKTKSIQYIYRHIETDHDGLHQFSCKTCYIPFLDEEMLKKHAEICKDTNVKSFACIECDNQKLFISESRFIEHIKNQHNSRSPLKCNICDVELLSAYHERRHMIEHNEDSLECQECEFTARTVHAYDIHMAYHRRNMSSYVCLICFQEWPDSGELCNNHYPRHLDSKSEDGMVCETCGQSFGFRSILTSHKRRCNKRYKCDVCDRKFASHSVLESHRLYHHVDASLKPICDQCGLSFFLMSSLKNHKRRKHAKEKVTFTCSQCSRSFDTKNTYDRHLRIHNNVYPYSCSYCGKEFRTKWNKDAHERQHTGEKPYACSRCGERFTHNVVRKMHEGKCDMNRNLQQLPEAK